MRKMGQTGEADHPIEVLDALEERSRPFSHNSGADKKKIFDGGGDLIEFEEEGELREKAEIERDS
jgi:hypothetical protein